MQARISALQSRAHADRGRLRQQAESNIDLAHACEKAIASAGDDYAMACRYARQQIEEFAARQVTSAPDVPPQIMAGCEQFAVEAQLADRELEQLSAIQELSDEAADARKLEELSPLRVGAQLSTAEGVRDEALQASAQDPDCLPQFLPAGTSPHEDIRSAGRAAGDLGATLEHPVMQCGTRAVHVPAESLSLEERWERSRAEARALTAAKAAIASKMVPTAISEPYDPYASQRHKRGRKSHLAAAINQNIHDNPAMGCVWFVIFVVLIVGSFILANLK